MMIYEYLIMISMLAGSALVTTTIWSREQTRMRLTAMLLFVAMLPALAGSGFMALSHPAPWIHNITVPAGKHKVFAVQFRQDESIFLWIDIEDELAPRAYYLPWTDAEAKRLEEMMDRQKETGMEFMVLIPGNPSIRSERVYHSAPQLPMPKKIVPAGPSIHYERTM